MLQSLTKADVSQMAFMSAQKMDVCALYLRLLLLVWQQAPSILSTACHALGSGWLGGCRRTNYEYHHLTASCYLHAQVCGIECFVARSGYTGEDGFEIAVPPGSGPNHQVTTIWCDALALLSELALTLVLSPWAGDAEAARPPSMPTDCLVIE